MRIDRMPTWKSAKYGQQWLSTLRDYAIAKTGRMPVDSIGQLKVLIFTCFTGSRVGEALGMRRAEIDFEARLWTALAERMIPTQNTAFGSQKKSWPFWGFCKHM